MTRLILDEQFSSIQLDLLGHFKRLKKLEINEETFHRLMHRQGISWLASINADIKIKNMSDSNELAQYADRFVMVHLENFNNIYKWDDLKEFDDRDFCLYKVIKKRKK